MFANVFYSSEGTLYKDFFNLYKTVEDNGIFLDYNFAIFVLPSYYKLEVAKYYLDKLFGNKPYVAFYSNFVASNDLFSLNHLVGMFITSDKVKENVSCFLEGFNNPEELVEYISSRNIENFLHFIFVPYPLKGFRKNFLTLRDGLPSLKATVVGALTGGLDYTREYPVITDRGVFKDGSFVVFSISGAKYCYNSIVRFKKLGPPFSFTSDGKYTVKTIDGKDAALFFSRLLKVEVSRLTAEYLTAFPMFLKPDEKYSLHKVIRFPKEVVEEGVLYWGDVPKKGEFNFIYLLGDSDYWSYTLEKRCSGLYPVSDFGIFFYCVGKSVFANPEKDIKELAKHLQVPFLVIGSYGELTTYRGKLYLLNGSTTFTLLRGGEDDKA